MELNDYIRYSYIAIFAVLSVIAFQQWRERRQRPAGWAALAFGAVALSSIGLALPEEDTELLRWTEKISIAILLLFPYLLLRFTTSFRGEWRRLQIAAGVVAFGVVLWNFTLPPIPSGNRPDWLLPFMGVVVGYWAVVSVTAAGRLWTAGRRQPSVARRRMRLMAIAVLLMTVGVLFAGLSPTDSSRAAFRMLNLFAAVMFFAGFSPPPWLRMAWRGREQEELRKAAAALIAATTPEEAAEKLLPHIVCVVGGQAGALLDRQGRVIDTFNLSDTAVGEITERLADVDLQVAELRLSDDVLALREPFGWLVIRATPYTPFFGREEIDLLHALGAFLHLALERSQAMEESKRELQRADDLKSEFLAMASHELRTPLTAITGFTSTMVNMWERLPDDEKQKFVGIIDTQGHRLTRLVDELLTLSRIEAGKLSVRPVPTDVSIAIKQTIRELGAEAVETVCPDDLAALIDADHLQQILVNYVGNALKYGEEPVKLTARAQNGWVHICVCDNGTGVPEEFVPHLFERFSRAGQRGSQEVTGTGLGLSIVNGLAKAHGGEAWYEPNQPHGSCFNVRLPAALAR